VVYAVWKLKSARFFFVLSLTLRDRRKWEVCVDFRGFLQPVRGGRSSSTSTQYRCGLRHGCCLSSRWRVKIVDDYSTNGIVGFHWFVSTLLHQRAPTSAPSVYWKSQLGKFWVVHWHLFFWWGYGDDWYSMLLSCDFVNWIICSFKEGKNKTKEYWEK